ncbi:MAG TPA: metalloregulator ArsR/SmtB family transcription factor [Candidatus Paceibacterota bacterium]|nr:metalloregulator ArsR/SmtB family transcription factor [Candidatus Paceibacterota bacterium]
MNTIETTKLPPSVKVTLKTRLPQEAYDKNANIYKVLANPKRLEILNLLKGGEMGVELMLKITGLSKANLSQHLALMRHSGLVQTRRQGQNIFYRIIDPRIVEPCKILHDLRTKRLVM